MVNINIKVKSIKLKEIELLKNLQNALVNVKANSRINFSNFWF